MQKRSEMEMLSESPLVLKFGETEYSVKVLSSRKAAAWRQKLSDLTGDMVGKAMAEPPDSDTNGWLRGEVLGSVSLMLTKSPEKLVDMICAYGSELNADEILDNGTDEQILVAFTRIMGVAFPFFSILGTLMEMQKVPSALPGSKFTN
jgi:hypothetical protein